MSLSKKNLDKLNSLIKNNNLSLQGDKDISSNNILNKNIKRKEKPTLDKDPSKIFYSLIDNSETLKETSEVNHLLRKSEKDFYDKNHTVNNHSKFLTTEDELYDEFNYLLEE